jgi:hypothetical protein
MTTPTAHVDEIRPRKDHRGVDLISDALPFGRLWYGEPDAIGYAKFFSRSHDAVIPVYDVAGNVIETHEHAGEFKEPIWHPPILPQLSQAPHSQECCESVRHCFYHPSE